jgi:hypothetical protein
MPHNLARRTAAGVVMALLVPLASAAPVSLQVPITFSPSADVPTRVLDECKLPDILETDLSDALAKVYHGDGKATSTAGDTLKATIVYVLGTAGGGFTGPKILNIRVQLQHDGQVERETVLHRFSSGGSTCSALERDSRALAKDAVRWLANPRAESPKAEAADGAASATEPASSAQG